jgi:hypothetical protein
MLHSLDNIKRGFTVDSYIQVNISKMGNIVAFQQQQRLSERATPLRYTHIAYLV